MTARRPNSSPISPPRSAPMGTAPRMMTRELAFTRPSKASGMIAWRRLNWLTSYDGTANPPMKGAAITIGTAIRLSPNANGKRKSLIQSTAIEPVIARSRPNQRATQAGRNARGLE